MMFVSIGWYVGLRLVWHHHSRNSSDLFYHEKKKVLAGILFMGFSVKLWVHYKKTMCLLKKMDDSRQVDN